MQTIQELLAMYPKGTVKSVECLYNAESTINLFTKGKRYNVKGTSVECDKDMFLRRTVSKFGNPEFHDFRMLPKEHQNKPVKHETIPNYCNILLQHKANKELFCWVPKFQDYVDARSAETGNEFILETEYWDVVYVYPKGDIINPHMVDGKAPPLVTGFVPKGEEPKDSTQDNTPEDSGGSCEYYKVQITNPTSEQDIPRGVVYIAECNDIIEALEMTYAEANMFKEIWRSAAARTLGKLKAGHSEARGSEKVVFFAERNRIQKGGRK